MEAWICSPFQTGHSPALQRTNVLCSCLFLAEKQLLQEQVHLETAALNGLEASWMDIHGHNRTWTQQQSRHMAWNVTFTGSLAGGGFAQTSQVLSCKSLTAKAGTLLSAKAVAEEKGPIHSELQQSPWKAITLQKSFFCSSKRSYSSRNSGLCS